jgi:hypothetical protein
MEVPIKSNIHKLLLDKQAREGTSQPLTLDKIYFAQLEAKETKEIRKLHEEWFPLSYPDNYFERINRNNIIAIGCFTDLDRRHRRTILGTIMVKVSQGNTDVTEIYKAKDIEQRSWFGWIK